jgi:hypothetical protein
MVDHGYELLIHSNTTKLSHVYPGASSSLGYRLCLTVIARRELVVAFAASQQDVDRLQTAGAYGIKMDSEMSFEEIKRKIREAVSFYGRIDFLVNNPEYDPPGSLKYVFIRSWPSSPSKPASPSAQCIRCIRCLLDQYILLLCHPSD